MNFIAYLVGSVPQRTGFIGLIMTDPNLWYEMQDKGDTHNSIAQQFLKLNEYKTNEILQSTASVIIIGTPNFDTLIVILSLTKTKEVYQQHINLINS